MKAVHELLFFSNDLAVAPGCIHNEVPFEAISKFKQRYYFRTQLVSTSDPIYRVLDHL